MERMTTTRLVSYRVSRTPAEHADALGAITFAADMTGGPFNFQDYLTADEAYRLAAELAAMASRVSAPAKPSTLYDDGVPF
jgi:hypothetical protein